jgi:hypothetical protein
MLRDLQLAIVAWLKDDEVLADVPVIASTKGNLVSAIETDLGKMGRCVVIQPVRGPLRHAGGKLSTEPTFEIAIFENVLVNRAQAGFQAAEDLMERICWLLRGGQSTPPPVFATEWDLVDDSGDELLYRVKAVTRGAVEVEVGP